MPDLLVSALRLRAAQRPFEGRCGGFDASLLRPLSGKELSRRIERRAWEVSRVLAGVAETFSGERMGQVTAPEARRRRATPFAGLAKRGGEIQTRAPGHREPGPHL